GLIVFGIVENLLWPVRARDALRARLAEVLRLLAELARSKTRADENPTVLVNDVDSWRRRISQKVEEVQGLIESSKFEAGDLDVDEIQKRIGDGQLVFVLLLSLVRQSRDTPRLPDAMRAAAVNVDNAVATALEALANHVSGGSEPAVLELEGPLNAFERTVAGTVGLDNDGDAHFRGRLALYRALSAAIERLSSEFLNTEQDQHRGLFSNGDIFFESQKTSIQLSGYCRRGLCSIVRPLQCWTQLEFLNPTN